MKKYLFLVMAGLALIGCGDKKEANNDNFKEAIDMYLDKSCIFTVRYDKKPNNFFPNYMSIANEQLGILVKEGLLTSAPFQIEGTFNTKRGTAYNITKKGEEVYSQEEKGFCAGKYEVKEIISFTEPSNTSDGITVANVKYAVTPKEVASWAKEYVKSPVANPNFADEISETPKYRFNEKQLILTNQGWTVKEGY